MNPRRYFFDIHADRVVRDLDGESLADHAAARDAAVRIAAELLPVHAPRLARIGRLAVAVRDETGAVLHELECRLISRPRAVD